MKAKRKLKHKEQNKCVHRWLTMTSGWRASNHFFTAECRQNGNTLVRFKSSALISNSVSSCLKQAIHFLSAEMLSSLQSSFVTWILVHYSLKIWHLVATVLMIFLRINWPNFVQKQYIESSDTETTYFIILWQVYPCTAASADEQRSLGHYRSFRRRVFAVSHLHWYWVLTNQNNQETCHYGHFLRHFWLHWFCINNFNK